MHKPSYQASKNNHFVYHSLTTSLCCRTDQTGRNNQWIVLAHNIIDVVGRGNQTNTPLSLHPSQSKTQQNPKLKPNLFLTHPTQTKPNKPPLLLPRYKKQEKSKKTHHVIVVVNEKKESTKRQRKKIKQILVVFACMPARLVFSRPGSLPLSESTHTNLGSTRTNGRDETDGRTRREGTERDNMVMVKKVIHINIR